MERSGQDEPTKVPVDVDVIHDSFCMTVLDIYRWTDTEMHFINARVLSTFFIRESIEIVSKEDYTLFQAFLYMFHYRKGYYIGISQTKRILDYAPNSYNLLRIYAIVRPKRNINE